MEESRIKVAVRSRPLNKREMGKESGQVVSCLESSSSVQVNCKPAAKTFSFDHVCGVSSTDGSTPVSSARVRYGEMVSQAPCQ